MLVDTTVWVATDGIDCWSVCKDREYYRGNVPPNYPVPATTENARFAQYPQWIADCFYWQDAPIGKTGWIDN